MATIDERRLLRNEFVLVARNVGRSQETLWRRDDQPDRIYTDTEAVAWLEQQDKEKR